MADEDLLDAPVAGSTKVRDRSLDLGSHSSFSSGQKREHGSSMSAAGMPSAGSASVLSAGAVAAKETAPVAAADAAKESEQASLEPVKTAELPLVYRLSDEQLLEHSPSVPPEVLEPIRDQFDHDAGVGELDPADPEYMRRWNVAGPTADERYRTLFGWAAYNDMSRRAAVGAAGAGQGQ